MKVKRFFLLVVAIVGILLSQVACDDSGDVTITPTPKPTPIPLGDDTVTETVDGVREFMRGLETIGIIGGEDTN